MRLSSYRGVEGQGADYAQWVRDLKGKSGIYIFRERGWLGTSGKAVYVGESHTGKLYETLTRHFQARQNTDPQSDTTYKRNEVIVAIKICEPGQSVVVQDAMICSLRPRDNKQFPCSQEEAPDTSFAFGANKEEEF